VVEFERLNVVGSVAHIGHPQVSSADRFDERMWAQVNLKRRP
jgi:hypothetical protein